MKTSNNDNPTNERVQFAIAQFNKHDIEYSLKNKQSGHFHCRKKSDDKLVQFWAGTEKIMSHEVLGIHNLIQLLTVA